MVWSGLLKIQRSAHSFAFFAFFATSKELLKQSCRRIEVIHCALRAQALRALFDFLKEQVENNIHAQNAKKACDATERLATEG
jgi:hypothetical protein